MNYKWVGAVLIISGCGGYGISLVMKYRKEEKYLIDLLKILQYMNNELQYRLTPLAELCRHCTKLTSGRLRELFWNLARELDWQLMPDARSCMTEALNKTKDIPISLRRLLLQLGQTLGQFDLPGQLAGIQAVQASCEEALRKHTKNQDIRVRNFQTLGLCAGAALAIILA